MRVAYSKITAKALVGRRVLLVQHTGDEEPDPPTQSNYYRGTAIAAVHHKDVTRAPVDRQGKPLPDRPEDLVIAVAEGTVVIELVGDDVIGIGPGGWIEVEDEA